MRYEVLSFYEFTNWTEDFARAASARIETLAVDRGIVGLCVTGPEGINATCASLGAAVHDFVEDMRREFGLSLTNAKRSVSASAPFVKFRAPFRREIVTLGDATIKPDLCNDARVSPDEFDALLGQEGVVALDTRNRYETRIGKFAGAAELPIDEFRDFGAALAKSDLPRDKTYLIYCTGGIRCEKAAGEMRRQGFSDVRQLDGGILRYLEARPEKSAFEGECFVFDRRVAVDGGLQPTSRWCQCPHCGQPAARAEAIACRRCGSPATVCADCLATEDQQTCSRNCAHHWRLTPGKRGRAQA